MLALGNVVAAGGAVLSCLMPGMQLLEYSQEQQNKYIQAIRSEISRRGQRADDGAAFARQVDAAAGACLNASLGVDLDLFIYGVDKD